MYGRARISNRILDANMWGIVAWAREKLIQRRRLARMAPPVEPVVNALWAFCAPWLRSHMLLPRPESDAGTEDIMHPMMLKQPLADSKPPAQAP